MSSTNHTNCPYCSLPESGFVRLPKILQVIPVGKSTFWKWIADGKAPKPIKLGPMTSAWRVDDIRALIASLEQNSVEEDDQ